MKLLHAYKTPIQIQTVWFPESHRMSKFLINVKKFQQSLNGWIGRVSPRLDYLMDKYHIIKVGCVVGSLINCYLIYDGFLSVIVLRGVKKEVDLKKELFYKRVENRKTHVFALMKELESENLLPPVGLDKQIV